MTSVDKGYMPEFSSDENRHFWECLARYFLKLPFTVRRRTMLRFKFNNGEAAFEKLQLMVNIERNKQRGTRK